MQDYFRSDLRLLRAALLYADQAEVASITQFLNSWRFNEHIGRDAVAKHGWMAPFARPWVVFGDLGFTWILARLAEIAGDETVSPVDDVPDDEAARAEAVLAELEPAIRAGLLKIPDLSQDIFTTRRQYDVMSDWYSNALSDASVLPVVAVADAAPPSQLDKARWEANLATALLGHLEGFPDASMDVILDVRERLTGARIHFRAAIAEAAQELASGDSQTIEDAVKDLRVRVIDPALAHIREELDAMSVHRTLMRLASDRVALATTAAQLSLAAGAGGGLAGLSALAHGLLSVPLASAAAKEIDHRSEVKRDLRLRPYWLLHEASSLIRALLSWM